MTIDRDTEVQAIAGWRAGDRAAGARLVAMHEGTIRILVKRYVTARVEMEDLVQLGAEVLLSAAASPSFDPSIAGLSAYAGLAIARKAVAYRRRTSADLSAGDETHQNLSDVQQAKPGAADRGDQRALARLLERAVRLDAPAGEDSDARLIDNVQGHNRPADELLSDCRERALAVELITWLKDRDREVIRRRYLCDMPEQRSAIAASMGVSRTRIEQIEDSALARLRKWASILTRDIC